MDDSKIFRDTLCEFVRRSPHLELVGASASARQGLRRAASTKPDLVLMDHNLPDLDGLEAAARIRKSSPAIRVFIMSADDSAELRARCRARGAGAFLSKVRIEEELIRAVAAAFPGLFQDTDPRPL